MPSTMPQSSDHAQYMKQQPPLALVDDAAGEGPQQGEKGKEGEVRQQRQQREEGKEGQQQQQSLMLSQ